MKSNHPPSSIDIKITKSLERYPGFTEIAEEGTLWRVWGLWGLVKENGEKEPFGDTFSHTETFTGKIITPIEGDFFPSIPDQLSTLSAWPKGRNNRE